jgi:hypothetical protein
VAKDRIKILGDWSGWRDGVRQGRLIRPDGEAVWVFIRARPDLKVDDEGFSALKKEGRLVAQIEHPSVLRLLHVARVDGVASWVFEGVQAVSLDRVIDVASAAGQYVPARAAIEIVERVVQGVRAAYTQGAALGVVGSSVMHSALGPAEVLVDAVGAVRVAGFSMDRPQGLEDAAAQGYGAFVAGDNAQRAVYALAALLVHLVGGERPVKAGSDETRQDAVIRRAMIRVLSRPGEAVDDAVIELIRQGLSFDPESRPSLTAFQDVLSEAAESLALPSLRAWAPETVPALLAQQAEGFPDLATPQRRRHIEASEDTNSGFVAPPVRKKVPREVPTTVGRLSVDPKSLMQAPLPPYTLDPNEATPYVGSHGAGSYPTSETDVARLHASQVGADGVVERVPMEIGAQEETWDDEPLQVPAQSGLGGWPLMAGLLLGMVVAVGVGVYVVDQMVVESAADLGAVAPTPAPQPVVVVELRPVPEVAVEPGVVAEPEVAVEPGVVAEPEAEPEPEAAAQPEVVPEPPAKVPPAAEAKPPPPMPSPDVAKKSAPAKASPTPPVAAPIPPIFPVTFRSSDTSIDRMVVRCHKVDEREARAVVHLREAMKGPCVVIGYRENVMVHSVPVVLKGPQNYTCFEGGARLCN